MSEVDVMRSEKDIRKKLDHIKRVDPLGNTWINNKGNYRPPNCIEILKWVLGEE